MIIVARPPDLFATPPVTEREEEVIQEIESLKERLRLHLNEPRRWIGSLRRLSFARNIQGSNSIEGYDAALDDAAAVAVGEEPLDATTETTLALDGYRRAMTYVLQLADEPGFEYNEQLLKSLHFMMTGYDLKNRPGRWRAGTIYVRNDETGDIVYDGADIEVVPDLMRKFVDSLNNDPGQPTIVRAAMAHLNLVMIHPFRDGNGRMARCLQSLVLARSGVSSPIFMSVEEYLGRNTTEYFDVLATVGGGRWQPGRDTRPWLRFMLTAHLRQARTMLIRMRESERMWVALEHMTSQAGLPERTVTALFDASLGLRIRNATYRANFEQADEEVSDQVAGRDLRQLVDTGFLIPHGAKRGRHYTASDKVLDVRRKIIASRDPRDDSDPFAIEQPQPF
ncbi:MAG: Fic family protein [Actinomycetota bacterium]|nr:Fic family protein [Actinomycetota bacterium]